ncbi:MAG: T9SS type A sorting domain-containing protein, partial [Bacteroidales bacterium]|nr:T9SS type A sorting domain-containing protein [Bacteroidales bacterium]
TEVYLDGQLVGSAEGYNLNATTYPLVVGALHNNYYNFKGRIDDVRVFRKALSKLYIDSLSNFGRIHKLGRIPEVIKVIKGQDVTLDAGSGYSSYLWWNGKTSQLNTISKVFSNLDNLTIKVKDSLKICYIDTFNISVINPSWIETASSNNVVIYPNPARDYVYILFETDEPKLIYLVDSNGKLLPVPFVRKNNQLLCDLKRYRGGFYAIILVYEDKIFSFKLLINK